ncbi:MAG TPA: SagB/ThcOx family dehydrogenase, partial [Candidatus Acidoferrales bacterium]|nr:SagB/ThcOx family dehydrogenase [Candidatus Acidoferrales bacterium]
PAGIPNELSEEEVCYELIPGIHGAGCLPDAPGPLPRNRAATSAADARHLSASGPERDAPLTAVVRRRRSALDFDAGTPPMQRAELEQLLDFATRDWPGDWRGTFQGDAQPAEAGADLVELYLYVHRVSDCEPGIYRWNQRNAKLEQLHAGNVQRVAAFLSLEQSLAGNSCFTVSMIADLAGAAAAYGNRGYRYVYFEAGAIGQRLYVGAEALGWNATGIGAFYDDDVHRYLGFLEEEEGNSVGASVREAEKTSLIMLGSPASRAAAPEQSARKSVPSTSEVGGVHHADPQKLPRQVVYHFAVGRAVHDPRLEAQPETV